MSDYLKAYQGRMARNQEDILQLIKEVQEKDPYIEAYVHRDYYDNDRYIGGVVFIKGEEINSIHFHEVPYRWSGCGHGEFSNSHYGLENSKMPFTAKDVVTNFKPINGCRKSNVEVFKNKEHYLNWCSYLTLYSLKETEELN